MMFSRMKRTETSLPSILVLLISGVIFTILTAARNQDPFRSFDERCSRSLYDSRTLSNRIMLIFSRLGSGFFTIPLGTLLFLSYKKTGEPDKSKLLLFNVFGVRLLNVLFKQLFKRRPPEWERKMKASKYGYPSAHTMNASAFYSFLLILSGLSRNIGAITGFILFLMMIGMSRVKLGIHFVFDMIAGMASGVFFNLAAIKLYNLFVKR